MEPAKGRVVLSKAGRDKGRLMAVTEADEKFVFVADGKERPLERPKRKNRCHLSLTKAYLSDHSMSTNRELRKALRALTRAPEGDA